MPLTHVEVASGSDKRYLSDQIITLRINIHATQSRIPDFRFSQRYLTRFTSSRLWRCRWASCSRPLGHRLHFEYGAVRSFETSGTINTTTQRHIAEDLSHPSHISCIPARTRDFAVLRLGFFMCTDVSEETAGSIIIV